MRAILYDPRDDQGASMRRQVRVRHETTHAHAQGRRSLSEPLPPPCPHDDAYRYGEHQGWLEEVENRRKTARSRPATARPGSGTRKDERPVLKPQQPTKWHEECVEMVGECRNCVTQALKAI